MHGGWQLAQERLRSSFAVVVARSVGPFAVTVPFCVEDCGQFDVMGVYQRHAPLSYWSNCTLQASSPSHVVLDGLPSNLTCPSCASLGLSHLS